jgi:hypothetical protein
VGVLVYLFFRASAEDNRSVSELISDIESGGSHARKQDMYALAVKVRDLAQVPDGAPAHFSADETKKLLGFLDRLDKNEDPAMREYLIAADRARRRPGADGPRDDADRARRGPDAR